MKIFKTILGAFVAALIFSGSSYAQQNVVFSLNTFDEAEITKAKQSLEGRNYFQLNEEIFANPELDKGAILELQKSDGNTDRLIVLDREEYMPGTVSIRAFRQGNPDNIFLATYNKGTLNGVFYENAERPIHFGYDQTLLRNFISEKSGQSESKLTCGIDHSKELVAPSHFNSHNFNAKNISTAAPLISADDDSVTIDLMIVYTQPAEDWALTSGFGDINGVIAQSMNLSQTALDNSETGIRLRLVTTHKTTYNEETDGLDESGDRLDRFTENGEGFMDEVHGIRDAFGADIVSLFVKISDTGGLGWRLDRSGGDPSIGFNLNRVQQVASGYTLIHEIGHNMGNAHSRTQSSSAASGGGGLFHYSVGFQNTTSNYHTVMAYNDDNAQIEAPYFSSPNLTFLGTATGANSSTTPSDNARSLREIKRTVSNYRDTQVDAPVASLLADVITFGLNREDNANIPFQIFNDGESVLVWDIDFGFSASAFKRNIFSVEVADAPVYEGERKNSSNYSKSGFSKNKGLIVESILYSTSFENGEGFSQGNYEGLLDWRVVSASGDFDITEVNPTSGSQNLRISANAGNNFKIISAPFLGFQKFGNYEITFDMSLSSTSETFVISIYDGKTGEESAGILIQQGRIWGAFITEEGGVSYTSNSNGSINANQYYQVKIVMDTDSEKINYMLDGVLIYQLNYLNGFRPGEFEIWHINSETNSTIDIDNLEIKQISAPTPWLSVSGNSFGYTLKDASSSRSLQFSTVGVSAGTYKTKMLVRTNDPQKPVIDVPITLTVADVVSNEETDKPLKLSLNQNYPNPFNPSTTISYALENSGIVQLDVFNIQGQRVATLINGKQQQGEHEIDFDASNLSSGVYIYRLQTATQTLTRQMVLIK